eukprot:COSAG05_NODE_2336_length_3214_cov_2.012520_1_plen_41_part_00
MDANTHAYVYASQYGPNSISSSSSSRHMQLQLQYISTCTY